MGGRSRCCTLQFGILLEAADFFQTQKVQVELIVEVRGGVQIILLALLDQELLIYALHLSPFKLSANASCHTFSHHLQSYFNMLLYELFSD